MNNEQRIAFNDLQETSERAIETSEEVMQIYTTYAGKIWTRNDKGNLSDADDLAISKAWLSLSSFVGTTEDLLQQTCICLKQKVCSPLIIKTLKDCLEKVVKCYQKIIDVKKEWKEDTRWMASLLHRSNAIAQSIKIENNKFDLPLFAKAVQENTLIEDIHSHLLGSKYEIDYEQYQWHLNFGLLLESYQGAKGSKKRAAWSYHYQLSCQIYQNLHRVLFPTRPFLILHI